MAARISPEALVGRAVRVYWEVDDAWFPGEITGGGGWGGGCVGLGRAGPWACAGALWGAARRAGEGVPSTPWLGATTRQATAAASPPQHWCSPLHQHSSTPHPQPNPDPAAPPSPLPTKPPPPKAWDPASAQHTIRYSDDSESALWAGAERIRLAFFAAEDLPLPGAEQLRRLAASYWRWAAAVAEWRRRRPSGAGGGGKDPPFAPPGTDAWVSGGPGRLARTTAAQAGRGGPHC